MIQSMTGFARVDEAVSGGRLLWELRAVNHRYLETTFKLPDDFRALEPDLRSALAGKVTRGKMEVALRFIPDPSEMGGLELDVERLRAVRTAITTVATELGLDQSHAIDVLALLNFPGVIRTLLVTTVTSPLLNPSRRLFDKALDTFVASREREGEKLSEHLIERADAISFEAHAIKVRYPQVIEQWRHRMRHRLAELGADVDEQRYTQEVAYQIQRLDIDEEFARLMAHLTEVRHALKTGGAIGRRLDFLMQELNREANTLCSKSQDAEMTRRAVEIKVMVEQMREMVQNIE